MLGALAAVKQAEALFLRGPAGQGSGFCCSIFNDSTITLGEH